MKVSKVTRYLLGGMILAAGILFFVENNALAEDVTITTYYPAPYGVYQDLQANKFAVGDTDGSGQLDNGDLPGNDGDLLVGGDVGIGMMAPTARLHVNGDIKAVLPNIGGSPMVYNLGQQRIGYDVAELFEASEEVEVGDLLVIDEKEEMELRKSHRPYERGIVGIVSGAPAILFQGSQLEIAPMPGGFKNGKRPPVALVGRLQCKVSIENGHIERGDLLTSSSTPGHAMKATDREKSFGTIVGKALEPFSGGPGGEPTGEIMILVALQ